MPPSRPLWRALQHSQPLPTTPLTPRTPWICTHCRPSLRPRQTLRHNSTQPGDNPEFTSILDNPPTLIRAGRRHNKLGLAVLAAIPVTAFLLGCWQVQRLGWKTDLVARFEDRLVRDPLPLPPSVDPDAVHEFDYRRVVARGVLRHDQEMLIGPRVHDGQPGYLVVTPLDRSAEFPDARANTKVLVNRGWIPKDKAPLSTRPEGLPTGEVVVQGLLREPWKRNAFTPSNKPEEGVFHFPDVHEMAQHTGTQAIWVEETMRSDLLEAYRREEAGIPIGRPPEVNLRNNHAQYIFTWFSLSLATSVMMWMVVRKPQGGVSRRVRQNKSW